MSNILGIKAWAEPLRTAAFGDITGSLTALGSPYSHPVRVYFFTNGTDATIYVSWNGTDNHFAILSGNSLSLDIVANKSIDNGLYLETGKSTYIAYATAPTIGNVYLSVV